MDLRQKASIWLSSRLQGLSQAAHEFRDWFNLLAVVLIPLGLLPFFMYSKVKTGDFWATIHAQTVGWGRYFEFLWQLLTNALRHPHPPNPLDWNFWLLNMIMILAFLVCIIW